MTKFHLLSDLHFEFGKHIGMAREIPEVEADYLVLAGDISIGTGAAKAIKEAAKRYKKVFYVPGNHECFGQSVETFEQNLQAMFLDTGVIPFPIRSGRSYLLPGEKIAIFGGTLWTDFDSNPVSEEYARSVMPEYNCGITVNGDKFQPRHTTEWNSSWQVGFDLFMHDDEIKDDWKRLVITHHLPSELSSSPEFKGSKLNPAFYSHLDHMVEQVDFWFHGHTHDAKDYNIGETRVVCNPGGYTHEHMKNGFNPQLIVEI